jgi:ribosomal protein S6
MKQYELTYLTPQELTEEEGKNLQDKLAGVITAKSGTVTEFQKAYKRRLAYPVQKRDVAYVNTVIFQLEPKDLETLNKELKEEAKILRSLTIIHKPSMRKEPTRVRLRRVAAAAENAKKEETEKAPAKKEKPKAELKEIEEKLDEILQ